MSDQTKSPTAPAPCDCLNWCGDDRWLRDGRATPCAARLKYDEKEAREIDRQINITRLLEKLGHAGDILAALQDLERLRRDHASTSGHLVAALRRLMREAVEHCDPIKIEGAIAEAADALDAIE